jgi:hypothetical protein
MSEKVDKTALIKEVKNVLENTKNEFEVTF